MSGRERALALDARDPLRSFRDRFVFDPDGVYLDGNSLGCLPRATVARLREVIAEQWGRRGIRGWEEGWMELPVAVGERIAAVALGAAPGQTAVGDSTTVCLYKLAYRTAAIVDMRTISTAAHEAGALTLWDLSHSAGSVPLALDDDGAGLAVGCTYKYLHGGPGAPAYMYVSHALQDDMRQPIWGWIGRRDPFEMAPGCDAAPGMRAFLSGTPPVLGLVAVDEGVRAVGEAGMPAVREKGIALSELAIELADAIGVEVGSPREAGRRGAHVALVHPRARELCRALIDGGVIVDYRTPDIIRFGFAPLTTRYVDVWDGIDAFRRLLAS